MLEIFKIREDAAEIIEALKKRHFTDSEKLINRVIDLDSKRKNIQYQNDKILTELNQLSKKFGKMMKTGQKYELQKLKLTIQELKLASKTLNEEYNNLTTELTQLLYSIPNKPNVQVPNGSSAIDNVIIHEFGTIQMLDSSALPHWDLIKKYDIIDFNTGNLVTGAGFPFYKGKGAQLQRALVNFFLNEASKRGFIEIQPPILINENSGYGTGQLPDKDGQMYHIKEENFFLIPTAEVPITNMYRDTILSSDILPIKHVGYTPCFRREAGSWGADVRGLNRLHQFDKVEIVVITHPDKSYDMLEEMSQYVQDLLKMLELPYRVLDLCAGDLGFTSAKTLDMEVYSAAQKKWLEVSSVSNFETYQANRLKLRYKGSDKKTHLLHTLNGSALALPRIIAAILENNQTNEGIKIPKVLIPYTTFDIIN